MIFASDNWAGAHPKIAAGLSAHATGFDPAYGSGGLDAKVAKRFNEIFEREVAVFFVATGTAANSLSLASVARPGGVVFASPEAHIYTDESGAPEYLSGGSRVRAIEGSAGKLDPRNLTKALASFDGAPVHAGQPGAVSITQATEAGTVYSLHEIAAITEIAKSRQMPAHMDGARFANALVSLGCTPAEMTWKSGIDMLSFGGTKNGCWCAEAVVFFDPGKTTDFPFFRMRAGQLHSKSRFIAAQFDAYFEADLWLENARHANAMTARLAKAMSESSEIELAWQPQANEIFAIMPGDTKTRLEAAGAKFYGWHSPTSYPGPLPEGHVMTRFVTSFATTPDHVEQFAQLLQA
jgi:threonine aldolase